MAAQRSKAQEEWLGDGRRAAVYWQGGDPRWQPRDLMPLTTTERADICIVGGGFTGLWTALSIKRLAPETDVVLVEREYCGAGASGPQRRLGERLGRRRCPGSSPASAATPRCGCSTPRGAASTTSATPCATAGSTATSPFEGGLVVALSPAQVDGVLEAGARWRASWAATISAASSARTRRSACRARPRPRPGVLILQAGSVQPALLAQGLRRLAVEAGVRVYEATPMVAPGAHAARGRQDARPGA